MLLNRAAGPHRRGGLQGALGEAAALDGHEPIDRPVREREVDSGPAVDDVATPVAREQRVRPYATEQRVLPGAPVEPIRSGTTLEAYRLDLRGWITWLDAAFLDPFAVERAHIELYARWSERTGRSIHGIEWFELFAVVRYAIVLERKFAFMRETNPGLVVPNFPANFIPELMKAVRA